jgi:uncharacterized membrane protein
MYLRLLLSIFAFAIVFFPFASFAQSADGFLSDIELEELQAIDAELQGVRDDITTTTNAEVSSREVRGRVLEIVSETQDENGQTQVVAKVRAEGVEYTIDTRESLLEGLRYRLRRGTPVFLQIIETDGEVSQVFLVDVVRLLPLALIALFFASITILVGRKRGLFALIGLAITLAVLFAGMFPLMLAGWNPVLVTVVGAAIILGVNMFLSHGAGRATRLAYLSTLIGLVLAVVFSHVFVWLASLSGFASETVVLLYFQSGFEQVPRGLLLAGFILGAVGVLDDIAITQVESVEELRSANEKLSKAELYKRAMHIGLHHIASTVNTLVLAYVGVALPLILLFLMSQDVTPLRFLNDELIAEELVRTLAGTSALVLTVPIATWLAAYRSGR